MENTFLLSTMMINIFAMGFCCSMFHYNVFETAFGCMAQWMYTFIGMAPQLYAKTMMSLLNLHFPVNIHTWPIFLIFEQRKTLRKITKSIAIYVKVHR